MSDNLVLALDADEAGIKAAGRAAREALRGGLNVKVARLPAGADPADLILKEGADTWKKAIRDSKDIITFLLDVLEEHSKGADRFRRAVEMVVLPFLSDVQSPIAREQYIREIGKRLDVSEAAVQDALAKVAIVPVAARVVENPFVKQNAFTRPRQAFAILLWQESLPQPGIDAAAFRKELDELLGTDTMETLKDLPEGEREGLRFSAGDFYRARSTFGKEAEDLLDAMRKDKISAELAEVTAALKKAEKAGDEQEIQRLITVNKMLTTRIAQLHEKV
jgi:DNA primase